MAARRKAGAEEKPVSATNVELDALVAEDPADLARYLVYADWLQERGDPRGELVVTQHALAQTSLEDPAYDDLESREARIFERHGEALLGPLAPLRKMRDGRTKRTGQSPAYRALAWRCGFVRALRLDRHGAEAEETDGAFVASIVPHPTLRQVEHLVAGAAHGVPFGATWPAMATVRSLRIATSWMGERRIAFAPALWSTMTPRLQRLAVGNALATLGAPEVPRLEALTLEHLDPGTIDALLATRFPDLRELKVSVLEATVDFTRHLGELRARMPRLALLTVERHVHSPGDGPADESELAARVVAAAGDLRVHLVMRVDDAIVAPNVTIDGAYPEDTLEPIDRFHHATAASLPT